jgi:hypothetical protein
MTQPKCMERLAENLKCSAALSLDGNHCEFGWQSLY